LCVGTAPVAEGGGGDEQAHGCGRASASEEEEDYQ
jgi:hypothetical protein